MRRASVLVHNRSAGIFEKLDDGRYRFRYNDNYNGPPISITMPISEQVYEFKSFPPFFDGLLPEGIQLEALLKINKIDEYDYFSQLIAAGKDLVSAVTVDEIK